MLLYGNRKCCKLLYDIILQCCVTLSLTKQINNEFNTIAISNAGVNEIGLKPL